MQEAGEIHAAFVSRHADVEFLAFKLWQERGAPFGTPDYDWFRAEKQLAQKPLTSFAKELGATLGTIAAAAGSVLQQIPKNDS